jgi:glutaredoxin
VVGDFANLREMFTRSNSRTVPVLIVGDEVVVGFDRRRYAEVLQAHGLET